MTKHQLRFCFAMIAATLICSRSVPAHTTADSTAKRQLIEAITKVREGETGNIRTEAAEDLAKLTKNIDPNKVDDRTLSEMAALLYTPEEGVRAWVARALGHFGPRARKAATPMLLSLLPEVDCILSDSGSAPDIRAALKDMGVTPPPPPPEYEPDYDIRQATGDPTPRGQLIEAITKVRYGQTPALRTEAAQQLAELTRKLGPRKVDNRSLAEIVAILYSPENSVRGWIATSLGNLGPRARRAGAPMLLELLPYLDCKPDSISASATRAALRQMGVPPPLPPAKCE